MIKTAQTIKKGDVFRSEYGDYGNFVNFVFVSCEADGNNWTKINVHDIGNDEVYSVYRNEPIDRVEFDVIKERESDIE